MNQINKKNILNNVKSEIYWFVWVLLIGVGLTAYAHTNFATKKEVDDIKLTLKIMDERIYDMHKSKFPEKHNQGGR